MDNDILLLAKLCAIIVHYEELNSSTGHPVDKISIDMLRQDPDVMEIFNKLDGMSLLPLKRS